MIKICIKVIFIAGFFLNILNSDYLYEIKL